MKDEDKQKDQLVREMAELRQKIADFEKAEIDRKRTEEALRKSEQRFRSLVEHTADSVFCYEYDPPIPTDISIEDQIQLLYGGTLSECNDVCARMYGYTEAGDVVGKKLTDLFGTVAGSLDEFFRKFIEGGYRIVDGEGLEISPDGTKRYYSNNGHGVIEDGRLVRVWGAYRDITMRKQAEEQTLYEQSLMQLLLTNIPDYIYFKDKERRFVHASNSFCDLFGLDMSYIIGKRDEELFPAEVAEQTVKDDKRVIETGISIINKEEGGEQIGGEAPWVLTTKLPWHDEDGNIIGLFGISREITERRRAEEALRRSEEDLQQAQRIAKMGQWELDLLSSRLYWSPTVFEIFEIDPEEFGATYEAFLDAVHPHDREMVEQAYGRSLTDKQPYDIEHRLLMKDGRTKWVNEACRTEYDSQGKAIRSVGIVQDITERKRAVDALKEKEEQLRTIGDNLPIGMIFQLKLEPDGSTKFTYVSAAVEELHECTAEEAIADPSLLYSRVVEDDVEDWQRATQEAARELTIYDHEMRIRKKSGELRHHRMISKPRLQEDGAILFDGLDMDITDRKRMEEELQKTQKLESVGILAGGIAHDFNNILTSLWGNIQLSILSSGQAGDRNTLEMLRESEKACETARNLTQQLLTFAKGGDPVKRVVLIADVVEESTQFALRGSNVGCEYSIPDDLWPVEADEGQIGQVIQNLVINADQAMPEGGTLKISAENRAVEGTTESLPLTGGPYVKVSIEDEGDGIPEDRLTKIFDPYFTTKQKGSGLGLAVSYSIIRKHGGHTTVDSELTRGSTFTFYLPASPKALAEQAQEAEVVRGRGKILLMDDADAVKTVGGRMLKHLGYKVEFASDGGEAIEMYEGAMRSNEPYDAVILDLTVPGGMGGNRCVDKLLEIDPDVRAVVSSGYSTDPVMSNYQEFGFRGVLPKPFRIQQVGEILSKVIERT